MYFKRRGLVYASVHDSYWTHACDVDEMSAALRDCFIKLHSRDLLGELKAGFEERYAGYVLRKSRQKHVPSAQQRASREGLEKPGPGSGMAHLIQARDHEAKHAVEKLEKSFKETTVSASADSTTIKTSRTPRPAMDLDSLKAEYGASALPPLAVARDENVLKELKEIEAKSGFKDKSDEEMLVEEEKMFAADEGAEVQGEVEEGAIESPDGKLSLKSHLEKLSSENDTGGRSLKSLVQLGKKRGKYKKGADEPPTPLPPRTIDLTKLTIFELSTSFPDIPPRGDFDLETIRDSPYFFS